MGTINCQCNEYVVAGDSVEYIPEHAVQIDGRLLEIGVQNKNGWGLSAGGESDFISRSVGIPIRMCNSLDPHACDFTPDNYSNIGYVSKTYTEDGWIKASAIITKKEAADQIRDGTWLPFNKGNWSVAASPNGTMDDNGMIDNIIPTAISLIIPPASPAYGESGYDVVVAAISEKLQSTNNTIEETMTDKKEDVDQKPPEVKSEGTEDTKEKIEQKPPKTKQEDTVQMYDQEAVDQKIADALETQKIEYDTQMAQMTPTSELEPMFAAAKTEAVETTLDQIKREKLAAEYIGLVTASSILSAPMMVDGKIDDTKLIAKIEHVKQLTASAITDMIDEAKLMVAALPAGQSMFDAAAVKSTAPGTSYDFAAVETEFKGKMGMS